VKRGEVGEHGAAGDEKPVARVQHAAQHRFKQERVACGGASGVSVV
jgi:hypothetical protein